VFVLHRKELDGRLKAEVGLLSFCAPTVCSPPLFGPHSKQSSSPESNPQEIKSANYLELHSTPTTTTPALTLETRPVFS